MSARWRAGSAQTFRLHPKPRRACGTRARSSSGWRRATRPSTRSIPASACWPMCASRRPIWSSCSATWCARTAAGVGEPLAREVVRAMMLIRANVLAKGFSGIRPLVAERLCDLLNRGVTPVVPSQGSVGASRRPGAAGPHGAGADRRRRSRIRGRACCPAARRCGAPASSRIELRSQGRHQPDQRHAGHAGHRLPGTGCRRRCWPNRPTWFAP